MAPGQGSQQQQSDDDFDDDDEDANKDENKKKDDDDGEEFDKEHALATIRKQRASEKALKADLKAVRDELKTLKTKDLPDAERTATALREAEEKATKAEAKLQKAMVRTITLEEAVALGFRSPSLAHRLIDVDDVDWEDDRPTNIRELLRDVLKSDPYLKGGRRRSAEDDDEDENDDEDEGADAGRGRRSGKSKSSGNFMNAQIRRSAGR